MRHALALACLLACTAPPEPGPDAGAPADDAGTPVDAGPPPTCVNGVPTEAAGPSDDVPAFELPGLAADGTPTTIRLHDLHAPCAAPALVLIRFVAPWCGPCRWDAAHTGELDTGALEARVRVVDLLVRGRDNETPDLDDARAWQALTDAPGLVALADDALFKAVNPLGDTLPFVVALDARTLSREYRFGAPDPDTLSFRLRNVLARLDGDAPLDPPEPVLVDGRYDRRTWDLIRDMRVPGAPPPDPTNAVADDPRAVALGRKLFSDTGLGPAGTVSCATCHQPDASFADGKALAEGVATGARNSPSALLASHARSQFWDGRADTLWAQALGPPENPLEMASTRTFVARHVLATYGGEWTALFGDAPDLSDTGRFPDDARPGTASWDAMAVDDRETVTHVYVTVGKSIAAFERSLTATTNRLDRYIDGDTTALETQEKVGLSTFFEAGCIQCHHGPRLTDDAFHVVRFPTGRIDGTLDHGRLDVFGLVGEFAASSRWSDARTPAPATPGPAPAFLDGAFKTPPLRGLTTTAPYGHSGSLTTLREVLENYSSAGLPPFRTDAAGITEPWVPRFALGHVPELEAFLGVLDASPAP